MAKFLPLNGAQGLHVAAASDQTRPVQCGSIVGQRFKQKGLGLDHSPPYSSLFLFPVHHLFHCEERVNVNLKARRTKSLVQS